MGKIYEALERARTGSVKPQDAMTQDGGFSVSPPGLGAELVTLHRPGSPMAETFRFLRSQVLHPPSGNPPRTLLVTSAVSGEGKTFIASNLAATLCQGMDEHVLLVDTDLRSPRIHRVFGMHDVKRGLSAHLADGVPLEELLQRTEIQKLTVLPGGNSTKRPAELLSSERMRRFIAEVRDRYPDRFVIFDSTPLELAPETFVIANEVDAVIMVVRCGLTPRHSVHAAMEKIQRDKLLGVVFNAYDKSLKTYYRCGYHSGYGYGTGSGYGTS